MITSKSELLSRHVAVSAYAVAVLLIIIPVVDTIVAVGHPMPLEISWRYHAENQISMALVRPMMGVLLAYVTAVLLEHRRIVKAISLASALLVAGFALGIPLFLIDALDMRASLLPAAQPAFTLPRRDERTDLRRADVERGNQRLLGRNCQRFSPGSAEAPKDPPERAGAGRSSCLEA